MKQLLLFDMSILVVYFVENDTLGLFLFEIIWRYGNFIVPLHRVFHGIRFKVKFKRQATGK